MLGPLTPRPSAEVLRRLLVAVCAHPGRLHAARPGRHGPGPRAGDMFVRGSVRAPRRRTAHVPVEEGPVPQSRRAGPSVPGTVARPHARREL